MTSDEQKSDGASDDLLRIDAVCDRFESALAAGENPSIEAFVKAHPELNTKVLRLELIRLELYYRQDRGEKPDLAGYSARYALEPTEFQRLESELHGRSERPTRSGEASESGDFELSPPDAPKDDVPEDDATREMLTKRGFRDIQRLGSGAYGEVHRAYDPERQCEVAIKTPTLKTLSSPKARERFLKEASIGEELDHPNLVKTLGIESFEGHDLIVLRFVDGQNLEQWFREYRKRNELPEPEVVVELMLPVAKALAHLHQRNYAHQDLKPENILIDREGNIFVTDFGLTIHESEQRSWRGSRAGTMAYMSPEQIEWKTHLIDGRSDIWSFGVILYRLLSGKFPFGGPPPESPSEQERYVKDLEKEITEIDARPIRQERTGLSRQLTDICNKCLEKNRKDRYENGYDLAEDLLLFLDKRSESSTAASVKRPIKIVPKGLRSFDAGDSEFFLELLPGPRHSDGVPESIRFLENRLSGVEGGEPLDIGIIFGPSGSGKSSLVKAGLMPRLQANAYDTLFIEATGEDTEVRLLKGLRKKLIGADETKSLVQMFGLVARRYKANGRKLLVIIDQFEQWLAMNSHFAGNQLVEAFRQCNGSGIQILILAREDFWWRLNEFTSAIELKLSENSNYLRVKLFDRDHARRILMAFGEAYGKLPSPERIGAAEGDFLDKALDDLGDRGEYVPVRLALFAEMMNDRPWTTTELKRIGGAKGVGVAFLESKFGPNAPIELRPYTAIAPKLLEAMLPPLGSDIKGQMLSVGQLRDATKGEPKKLQGLLNLMEGDLKLLTKVAADQPEGEVPQTGEDRPAQPAMYQLTHDYLVGSIRDWLDERSRSSRGGRAKLMLRTQTELWNRLNRSKRYLPTSMEWLGIRLRTTKAEWTPLQAAMMRDAAWRAARNAFFAIAGVAVLALGVWVVYQQDLMDDYQRDLRLLRETPDISNESNVVGKIETLFETYRDKIDAASLDEEFGSSGSVKDKTLRAMLLVRSNDDTATHLDYLLDRLVDPATTPETWRVLQTFLKDRARRYLVESLTTKLDQAQTGGELLRTASAMLDFDDLQPLVLGRSNINYDLINAILDEPHGDSEIWGQALVSSKATWMNSIVSFFRNGKLTVKQANHAATMIKILDDDSLENTIAILIDRFTEIVEFQAIISVVEGLDEEKRNSIEKLMAARLNKLLKDLDSRDANALDCDAIPITRLALATWQMGRRQYLQTIVQPRPVFGLTRGLVIEALSQGWIGFDDIWQIVLKGPDDDPMLATALLAIQEALELRIGKLSPTQLSEIENRLHGLAIHHPSSEIHATALFLWRKLQKDRGSFPNYKEAPIGQGEKQWRVGGVTQLEMVTLELPNTNGESHRFEIANTELRHEVLAKSFEWGSETEETIDLPATLQKMHLNGLEPTISTIAELCNKLSECEGIEPDEHCYRKDACGTYTVDLNRSGYRIPTLQEWKHACSGTGWNRQFLPQCVPAHEDEGHASESSVTIDGGGKSDVQSEEFLRFGRYVCFLSNTDRNVKPVATRLPNPSGIFDMYGNIEELVMDTKHADIGHVKAAPQPIEESLVAVGMSAVHSYWLLASREKSTYTNRPIANADGSLFPDFSIGIRLARTIPQD